MNTTAATTRIVLFGATTPSGDALLQQSLNDPSLELVVAGRRPQLNRPGVPFVPCDLRQPLQWPDPKGEGGETPQVWLSFAPIWELAPFLAALAAARPAALAAVRGVVACSSSSVITKRFATNSFDQALVRRLREAEELLERSCSALGLTNVVLAPTLIYGASGSYGDRNLSRLSRLMQRLPLLPVPALTGLRQPLHCSQLAAVTLSLARRLAAPSPSLQPPLPRQLAVGGDDTLSYGAMLERLRHTNGGGALLPLPPRLFYALAAPLLMLNPKQFEAVLRMGADLAGFTPAHQLLGGEPQPFPLLPLAR
ncbi:hypothetical protein KBY97_03450 [Synechococcus sp. ATX 2A4]|uniref:hypothetical protein n=1 Tax=Synechococcus sp. ATX 2A4 TaxID=2823727 RepID=UPI0020CC874D|nr:hypothetical protein [Synechococcus sp. ATX 2A4]MCP9884185.1 hypothetical protein [Synechococcus sp. ATX 2A4]